jgi:hypothetical protein
MADAEAEEALLKIAADYDRLAERALKRARAKITESSP